MNAAVYTAFPKKQFTGENDKSMPYETYMADKEAFIISNDMEEFFAERDPSTISRVTVAYTVPADDDNDPHEPPGTNVRTETEARYENRCARYKATDRTNWAKFLPGWGGKAREVAMRAPIPYSAKSAIEIVDRECGKKTEKQVTKMVKEFTSREKRVNQTIEDYNKEWVEGVRQLRRNGMDLPDKFVESLYLNCLGRRYKTLDTVASVLPDTERTLAKLMQMAVDHVEEETDEANNTNMAMAAANVKNKKRVALAAFGTNCTVCNGQYHTAETCFAKGGGLQHPNASQRSQYLNEKRQQRHYQRQNRGQFQFQQQQPAPNGMAPPAPIDGQAMAAFQQFMDMRQKQAVTDAATAPGAKERRELEMLKQQVDEAGLDVSNVPIHYGRLSRVLGYDCHE